MPRWAAEWWHRPEKTPEACAVCFDPVDPDEPARVWLQCEHGRSIHQACLAKWVRSSRTCPVCRGPAYRIARRPPAPARWVSVAVWLLAWLQEVTRAIACWWFAVHQRVRDQRQRMARSAAAPSAVAPSAVAPRPEPTVVGIRQMTLRQMRAVAAARDLDLTRHRLPGERLSRTNDYRTVLLRALAG